MSNKFHMIAEIQTFSGLDAYTQARSSKEYKEILIKFRDVTTSRQEDNGTFVFENEAKVGYICTNTGYVRRYKDDRITQISKVTNPFENLLGYLELFNFVIKKSTKYIDRQKYPSANYYNVWVDNSAVKYMIDQFKRNGYKLLNVEKTTP